MRIYNLNIRISHVTYLLLFCLLCWATACRSINVAEAGNVSNESENRQSVQKETNSKIRPANLSKNVAAKTPALDVNGTYILETYREGGEGYKNSLTVTKKPGGKINIYYDGTFLFHANGAETFHNTEAEGELLLKGNTASGKLIETGSEGGCRIALNFSGERVNLKSSDCDLRVTPDGDYKRGSFEVSAEENSDASQPNETEENAPRIQYDADNIPTDIINLMEREGDREGCGDENLFFTGKVLKVDYLGDYIYEFTLAGSNRKRQNFALVVNIDDKLPIKDMRSIIKTGNNLEVRYINCGNAPIATPLSVYSQP